MKQQIKLKGFTEKELILIRQYIENLKHKEVKHELTAEQEDFLLEQGRERYFEEKEARK